MKKRITDAITEYFEHHPEGTARDIQYFIKMQQTRKGARRAIVPTTRQLGIYLRGLPRSDESPNKRDGITYLRGSKTRP